MMQNHHITPRCMLKHKSQEFVDHPSNRVDVTFKHHVALHKWLFMLTGHKGCESAYHSMSGTKNPYYCLAGSKRSNETKKKMSDHAKTRTYSIETRKKMSDAKKGKHPWNFGIKQPELSAKRIGKGNPMFGIKGKDIYNSKVWVLFGKLFFSSAEASKFFGIGATTIRRWCNNTHVPLCYSFTQGSN